MTKQKVVYYEEDRYAGWPANYGIWSWGNEIVVGFTVGYHNRDGGFHTRDRNRPFVAMQARSFDGGENWETIPTPCETPDGKGLSADEHVDRKLKISTIDQTENAPTACPGVDFTNPDFALMCGRTGLNDGAISWFYTSIDRCRSWQGPYQLPMFGLRGISARTDYLIDAPQTCTLFLTSAKSDGNEGRVFCAKTIDGGKHFRLLSLIGDEPEGFEIMPASVRLSPSEILVAVRTREGEKSFDRSKNWIDLYLSEDNGENWTRLDRPVENTGWGGNPPTMTKLIDGRICLTYGDRDRFGMYAKVNADNGLTWSDEICLRDDGGSHDIGYPRSVQRSDGKMVTIYYFADAPDGMRHIAATIWQP